MSFLGPALWAEGATDHAFFKPLLGRVCEDLVLRHCSRPVDMSEVVDLNRTRPTDDKPTSDRRKHRIHEAATRAQGSWNILFVHSDGEGNVERVRKERVQPAIDICLADASLCGSRERPKAVACAVIPVREMESWALADRKVLGFPEEDREPDPDSGDPPNKPRLVEKVPKPKEMLVSLIERRDGLSSRSSDNMMSVTLNDLGETISLARLRNVPSFQTFERELLEGLKTLGLISVVSDR